VHCSAAVRAREAEDDDDDAPEEDLRIPWGDAFEVRMVEMIAESKALEDELCTNPPADRQAKIGRRLASLSKVRALGEELQVVTAELQDLVAVADDDGEDAATRSEFRAEADRVAAQQAALRDQLVMQLLPKDEDDDLGAIVEVRAAAGGLEASLFAGEVFAMYQKFALRKGWRWEQLAVSESEAGGLREASAAVSGTGVFGVLKYESGVHRVQRVPVTEGAGRVHTSTVSVAIIPDAETADFEVRDADLKVSSRCLASCPPPTPRGVYEEAALRCGVGRAALCGV
jgi:peptide chain release factor 1